LDIWFQIRIKHQILNKMNTWKVIIIFISKKNTDQNTQKTRFDLSDRSVIGF
jgi:hypothetical protein